MKFLKFMYNILTELVDGIAELELKVWADSPSTKQHFRRLYFKLKGVTFDKRTYVGANFTIRTRGNIKIGDRVSFGADTKLYSYAQITIGDDFISAKGLTINTGSHDPNTLVPFSAPVVIGNRVWCGMDVTILPGITIGDDVCIGAGSIVTKDIPSNSAAVGVPAKVIKDIHRDGIEIWRTKWY
jgi:maltose O-acetyltransferase